MIDGYENYLGMFMMKNQRLQAVQAAFFLSDALCALMISTLLVLGMVGAVLWAIGLEKQARRSYDCMMIVRSVFEAERIGICTGVIVPITVPDSIKITRTIIQESVDPCLYRVAITGRHTLGADYILRGRISCT